MKRYLLFIITIIFTIVVIGTFYVKTVIAGGKFPTFAMEKISGNEDYAKQLVLHGSYSNHNHVDDFRIVNNQVDYFSKASFMEKAMGIMDPKFDALIKEYRNFMRAKDYDLQNFYEDQEKLVYAEIGWSGYRTLEVDVLDKSTEKSVSFKKQIPDNDKISYSYIENVQVNEANQVEVVVQNFLYNQEDASEEYRLYTFDVDKGEFVSNDLITSIPVANVGWSDNRIILNEEHLGKEKYLLIRRQVVDQTYDYEMDDDGEPTSEPHVSVDDYVIFNMQTKESEVLTIPEDRYEQITENLEHIHGSTLYFLSNYTENGSEVLAYDIESQTFGEPVIFDGMKELYAVRFYKNQIYFIHNNPNVMTEAFLKIGNIDTGEVLYEGVIKDTNEEAQNSQYEMIVYNVSVYE